MARTKCGFDDSPQVSGRNLLTAMGPTLLVDIGFDPNYNVRNAIQIPIPGIRGVQALVDTGAQESCIDSMLAAQLRLPIVDRRRVSGIGGEHIVNVHLAQVHVPSLGHTAYGTFSAVHLAAGGQQHLALIGRTFLYHFTMIYEGRTGTVTIHNE
jgi:predicted aspartyl protease